LLALSACGFTPAYGPGGPAAALRNAVIVADPTDRSSFDLAQQLKLRLGQPDAPRYMLDYKLTTRRDGVGVTPEQEIIRYNTVGSVTYSIKSIETGSVVASGKADSFTSYSVGFVDVTAVPPSTSSTVSTRAAARDANARLMVILADDIVTQLLATASDWAK